MKKFLTILLAATALSTAASAVEPSFDGIAKENAWKAPNLDRSTTFSGASLNVPETLLPQAQDGSAYVNVKGDANTVSLNQVKGGEHHAVVNIGSRNQAVLQAYENPSVADPLNKTNWSNGNYGNTYGKGKASNNKVSVDQVGQVGRHLAYVNLVGDANTLAIKQDGKNHTAFVQLGDSGSNYAINQTGNSNTATVQMMQGAITGSIVQANSGNQAHIIGAESVGSASIVNIDQSTARDSRAMVSLGNLNAPNGGGNTVNVSQTGTAFANIAANGSMNNISVNQGR